MRSKFKWIFTLLVALTMQFSFAQQKTVTGTVISEGVALPGASVKIKGSSLGTTTDSAGKYSIKTKEGDVLVVTFVGKPEQSATVGASNVINFTLSGVDNEIKEVVVTGAMGIRKKKDAVTSTVQTVTAKEINAASNPDAVRALVGKVSGVQINATTNGVNGDNAIRIRSMLSFTGNTEALVVIDDVISSASVLSALPPTSIQSVTVLKGAQGAAIYGAQGKSGVVVVTTKKGSASEKMSVSLNSSVDFENINFVPQKQTKYGQGWYGIWDPQENGGWGPLFDGSIRQVGLPLPDGSIVEAPYSSRGYDAIKDFYKTGATYQNNLALGLSGKDSYFNLNLGNLKRDFILDGDMINRNTVVLNAGKKIGKLSLGTNINFINQRVKQANVNASTSRSDYTLLTNLLQGATNIPLLAFKDRGIYGYNGYYQNPWWAKDNNRLEEDRNYFNLGLRASYDISKNITFTLNNSVQTDMRNQISYSNELIAPSYSDGDFSSAASFYQSEFTSLYYYGDFMLNFKYDLSDKLKLNANLGQNFQYSKQNRISQGGKNFDIPGWYNIQNVLNPDNPANLTNTGVRNNLTATFANIDLNYNDYLFLNLTSRYEGNSVGIKGNNFFFYPSAGVSFIPTKAIEALKDVSFLSNLKLYSNITKIGSLDPINPHETLETASVASNFPYPNTGSSYNDEYNVTGLDIKPEMYLTFEAGINLGLFGDRLGIDASYYNTKTTDLITRASLSSATGLASKLTNNGELKSKGFEVDLSYDFFKNSNFKWNGRFSYWSNNTKVVDAGEGSSVVIFDGGSAGADFTISGVEGQNFPAIMGTDWLRDPNGNVVVNAANGSPIVDPSFKYLGKATPDTILGWTNNFEYKGFGLSFTIDYRTGHSFISQTKYNLTWNGHLVESAEFDRNVGFIYPNSVIETSPGVYSPNTSVLTGGGYGLTGAANKTQSYYGLASGLGSFNLIDASSLKVREIALSYNIPSKLLKKTGLSSFKVSVNARNPFVFLADGKLLKAKNGGENLGYADPEASSQFNRATSTAAVNAAGTMTNTARNGVGFIGDAQYPSTRTFGFTINATF